MTPEMIALGRRAVATGRIDLPCMAVVVRRLLVDCGLGGPSTWRDPRTGIRWVDVASREAGDYEWIPDLSDPATLGCLLALVLDAYRGRIVLCTGDGYAETLVVALEAAP